MKTRLLIIIVIGIIGFVGLAYAHHDGTVHSIPNAEMIKQEYTVAVIVWDKTSYFAPGTGIVRVTDSDMNLNPDRLDTLDVQVWSDSDAGGIDFVLIETDDSTGVFEGTVSFTPSDESSGRRLRVLHGDTLTAKYTDATLPLQHTTENLDITTKSKIKNATLSPLKQQLSGISPNEIICKDRFKKIFKHDGSVACAKPLTVEKLIHRGWGTLDMLD